MTTMTMRKGQPHKSGMVVAGGGREGGRKGEEEVKKKLELSERRL